jgi:hypothetical protein
MCIKSKQLPLFDTFKNILHILKENNSYISRRREEMDYNDKPKFNIGDTVVITLYGTVGKITKIKHIDEQYLYEVNESHGLYNENCLVLLAEYRGDLPDKEQIDIEYKFFFGDLVQVNGYKGELFKVVGFRTEIWRYQDDAWEDIIYELTRVTDGEWLEADEEELLLIADADQADAFLKKYGYTFSKHHHNSLLLPPPRDNLSLKIDRLLDAYNDYKILYETFKDECYLSTIQTIKKQLSDLANARNERLEK